VTGSLITVAAGDFTIGTTYRIIIHVTKSASGTANIVLIVRLGTSGSTSDTNISGFITLPGGTAVADTGIIDLFMVFKTVGGAGSVSYVVNLTHNLTTTGLWNTATQTLIGSFTAGTGGSTTTATKIGLSYNGGTSASHTLNVLKAELYRP
jgi:hypothetical protein